MAAPTTRSPAGYRLYDLDALLRLELLRTLRELGMDLATIQRVLDRELSVAEVAAAHADAMDVDLVRRPRRPDLGISHTGPLRRAERPEELFTRTAPLQGPDDEELHQVAHRGTVRPGHDSRPA
ncbi:DNA-binding transcriptional MerR regulator [Streptomyces sp. B4I13]|nr:DNA-binding transcriptional MerR regulator [Streptomyces sp. B4I13]